MCIRDRHYGNGIGLRVRFCLASGTTYDDGKEGEWVNSDELTAGTQVNFMSSTSNRFMITGVQLEEGNSATPFEHRSYGEELALCQRYYQQIVGHSDMVCVGPGRCNGTTNVPFAVPLSVPLRASPVINACNFAAFTANNQANISNHTPAVTKWDANNNILTLQVSGLSGMTNARSANMFLNSSHTLSMDAEL